jgi:hypothetical protein
VEESGSWEQRFNLGRKENDDLKRKIAELEAKAALLFQ